MNDIAKALASALDGMLAAFRDYDLPYGSEAYRLGNEALNAYRQHGPTLAALVADGERLDWLEQLTWDYEDIGEMIVRWRVKMPGEFGRKRFPGGLRDAIDAARAGGGRE